MLVNSAPSFGRNFEAILPRSTVWMDSTGGYDRAVNIRSIALQGSLELFRLMVGRLAGAHFAGASSRMPST